jgi:hypothetical protein
VEVDRLALATVIAGGEYRGVGEHQGSLAHLWAAGIGSGQAVAVARRRPCGRRRRWAVGAAVRWSEVAWGRPGSFTWSQGIQPWGHGGARVTEVTGPRRQEAAAGSTGWEWCPGRSWEAIGGWEVRARTGKASGSVRESNGGLVAAARDDLVFTGRRNWAAEAEGARSGYGKEN